MHGGHLTINHINRNHVLPPEWNATFKVLYDDAPVCSYSEILPLFIQDFGKTPEEIYASFDPVPIASASIAQVHKAVLKDGTKVAVKVQKPYLQKQMDWDLRTYSLLTFLFEKVFDLPLTWSVEYIQSHLRQEVDFINEGRNAEKAYQFILEDAQLREQCYVPKVYWDQTSKRVLTCEWIDGIKFGDRKVMEQAGLHVPSIMNTIVNLFADQIFRAGFIHCDPHPG